MSQQLTFADSEFSSKRRQTRKEVFLGRMDDLLPWDKLLGVIEPVYPKAGNGRRPYPLETMLRIHCMQQWYNLSDEAMDFMLTRFSRDLSSLMQLLDQLDAYALQTQRAITIPLIKSMLENQ